MAHMACKECPTAQWHESILGVTGVCSMNGTMIPGMKGRSDHHRFSKEGAGNGRSGFLEACSFFVWRAWCGANSTGHTKGELKSKD